MKRVAIMLAAMLLAVACQQQGSAPVTDTHGLAEEVHHQPELARKIIADVVGEQHGVTMIAEELAKNEMAAASVVDELMKQPAIAAAIADRCAAAAIARQAGTDDLSPTRR